MAVTRHSQLPNFLQEIIIVTPPSFSTPLLKRLDLTFCLTIRSDVKLKEELFVFTMFIMPVIIQTVYLLVYGVDLTETSSFFLLFMPLHDKLFPESHNSKTDVVFYSYKNQTTLSGNAIIVLRFRDDPNIRIHI